MLSRHLSSLCDYPLYFVNCSPRLIGLSLPQIILSRFIINLRYTETSSIGADSSVDQDHSRSSHINFRAPSRAQIVGNIGEPLDFKDYDLDGEIAAESSNTLNEDGEHGSIQDSSDITSSDVAVRGSVGLFISDEGPEQYNSAANILA